MGRIGIEGVKAAVFTDRENLTGATALIFERGAVGSAILLGGGTSTRGFDSLKPDAPPTRIFAFLVSGGSSMGLDSASGVVRYLKERELGLPIDHVRIPLVSACIIFDLFVGNPVPPDPEMVYEACKKSGDFIPDGPFGAGTGATVGKLYTVKRASPGGQCYEEIATESFRIGCLSVVNAFGDIVESGKIISGARNERGEFVNSARKIAEGATRKIPSITGQSTTICCIITDAKLTKPEAYRVAVTAAAGMARAIDPVWTIYDGDIVAVLSVGERRGDVTRLGTLGARLVEETIRKAVTSHFL